MIAFQRVFIAIRTAHFDVSSCASNQGGDAAGFVRVLSECGHERQVDVYVRVNETGEHELTGGIDHFGVRRRIKIPADARNGFAFGVDVGVIAGIGGDNFTILYE